MIMEKVRQRFGSLIKLKPEYEERYIILHKHTFPEVLTQIHDSNIRNYSIYLRDGILFSFFEYVGTDFSADMEHMAKNEATQDWWKLTDPMQDPFDSRKEGEWWSSLDESYHFGEKQIPSYQAQKCAFVAHSGIQAGTAGVESDLKGLILQNLTVFNMDTSLYIYLEDAENAISKQPERFNDVLQEVLQHLSPDSRCAEWHPMRQVFQFD